MCCTSFWYFIVGRAIAPALFEHRKDLACCRVVLLGSHVADCRIPRVQRNSSESECLALDKPIPTSHGGVFVTSMWFTVVGPNVGMIGSARATRWHGSFFRWNPDDQQARTAFVVMFLCRRKCLVEWMVV